MKPFKYLANTSKTAALEKLFIYTVICDTDKVENNFTLKKRLSITLGQKVIKVRKLNYCHNGFRKLYVQTEAKVDWL